MPGQEYISADTSLGESSSFWVGVLGSKNPNSNINIATFRVIREFNGVAETVHEDNDIDKPYLSWESKLFSKNEEGQEKLTFSITDYSGLSKEISLLITTYKVERPGIVFIGGIEFTSEDDSLPMASIFKAGINAFSNQTSNAKLSSFFVTRASEHTNPTIVFEEDQIDDILYTWQGDLIANTLQGNEVWSFEIEDQSGTTNVVEFTITTVNMPITPVFSPTYLVVNHGGIEVLDFYITCVSHDWEMVKIVVSYPDGLGSEAFIGNGEIINAGSPYYFSKYFQKVGGTWTFSILGYVKSGPNTNQSFTAITSVDVTGK
jgi:hypothetical protein